MRLYKNHIRFFLLLFLFTVLVAGIRLHWISKAVPSNATVLSIEQTRFTHPKQHYPVVSYPTNSGEVVTRGTYNLPVEAGQTVDILYNPNELEEFRLNTTYWLWYDIWSWYRLIWIVIALYYLVLFIVKRSLRHNTQPVVEYDGGDSPTVGGNNSGSIRNPGDTFTFNPERKKEKIIRVPRVLKAVLLLLVPIALFLIGQVWDVPYTREVAAVLFLGLVALGSPSASTSDGDI